MDTPAPAPPIPRPRVVILCTDLIFSTKIAGTGKAIGVACVVARDNEKLRALLDTASPDPLVIVDLNVSGVDPMAAIALARAHPLAPRIVAYVSHVQVDLAMAAREAGADQILARSAFVERLPVMLGAEKL
jgi:DNA-binding response OmpR family regulator